MENLNELKYSKSIIETIEKLEIGLKKLEEEYKEYFSEISFSHYFFIQYPPNPILNFTEESNKLPKEIILKSKNLCKQIIENLN